MWDPCVVGDSNLQIQVPRWWYLFGGGQRIKLGADFFSSFWHNSKEGAIRTFLAQRFAAVIMLLRILPGAVFGNRHCPRSLPAQPPPLLHRPRRCTCSGPRRPSTFSPSTLPCTMLRFANCAAFTLRSSTCRSISVQSAYQLYTAPLSIFFPCVIESNPTTNPSVVGGR